MPDFEIQDLPDVSFIDNKTIDDVRQEMVADCEKFMSEETGKPFTLERADIHRMELNAAAAQIYQAMQYIDRAGKQNLLKYSYSDFLDPALYAFCGPGGSHADPPRHKSGQHRRDGLLSDGTIRGDPGGCHPCGRAGGVYDNRDSRKRDPRRGSVRHGGQATLYCVGGQHCGDRRGCGD